MQAGFHNSPPRLVLLAFAIVRLAISSVVGGISKHQLVWNHPCQTAADSKVVRLYPVVLNTPGHTLAAPAAISRSRRIEQRIAYCATVQGPAGGVFAIIEIIVQTAQNDISIMENRRVLGRLLLFCSLTLMHSTGLIHGIMPFISDIAYPGILAIEGKGYGVDPVREILESHS